MNSIKMLPQSVYDLIAAGEVVTGPYSVVKESVENAIDAGAGSISVEIKDGGRSYISVSDDGEGIRADEIELSITAHATSKISSGEDLNRIDTLGFRGEALASIAAVSRMELTSKTEDSQTAAFIKATAGTILETGKAGAPDGTKLIVKDLFFNTPARLKFLKSDRSETSRIVDFVSKAAVSRPDIKFRMITGKGNDTGNVLFSTDGRGDALRAVSVVYGPNISKDLREINFKSDEGLSVKAYISGIGSGSANRKTQVFYVNGRYVKDSTISTAISDGYKGYVQEGRHPVVFLFLNTPLDQVDVNVHPAKSELRFKKPGLIHDFIVRGLSDSLKSVAGLPKAMSKSDAIAARRAERDYYSLNDTVKNRKTTDSDDRNEEYEVISDNAKVSEVADVINVKSLWSTDTAQEQEIIPQNTTSGKLSTLSSSHEMDDQISLEIPALKVIDTVFGGYILASDSDNLYFIDQHAAHERINYEQFIRIFGDSDAPKQGMLNPYIYQLSAASREYMQDGIELLIKLGFDAEQFGESSVAIRSFPVFLTAGEAENFCADILESDKALDFKDTMAIERLIARSCKAAVKIGDKLDTKELMGLIESLSQCDNPYTCPHGRPVFVRMTRTELEKMFLR